MITLILAFHNHQPVGNFGWVFDEACRKAYRPLMEVLRRHPSIRYAQHYTGILLDWFRENDPELLAEVDRQVKSGRLELLSGGYYEPILAALPERDRQAQIAKLNARIHRDFGVLPTGMWLAERVWEPSLPSTLYDAGIGYTFLDDTHFRHAGLGEDALRGAFLTEDQGKPLTVFPIDRTLRYTMPFEKPEATFDYLRSLDHSGGHRIVVFADDGEKFGIWPDTYRTVYEEGWLERFCELLEENSDWVRTATPSEACAALPPAGRIYLPTASYAEMLHWALPTPEAWLEYEEFEKKLKKKELFEQYESYVRGGFWRNFLVKYPEVNAMQKKMLRVSNRLSQVEQKLMGSGEDAAERYGAKLEQAGDHLMAGQCNCPYWHGVFGGIYLPNIRSAVYSELIAAEAVLDELEGIEKGEVTRIDYDLDGNAELLIEHPLINLYLSPAHGGTIFEFDYKPLRYNFGNLMRRRPEGYHAGLAAQTDRNQPVAGAEPEIEEDEGGTGDDAEKAPHSEAGARSIHDAVKAKEEGLEKFLVYDSYRPAMLVDHFYPSADGGEEFNPEDAGLPSDLGDFSDAPYTADWERHDRGVVVRLHRIGQVEDQPVEIEKVISIPDGASHIGVEYRIRSTDGLPLKGRFGPEIALTLSAGNEPDRYYEFDGTRAGRLNSAGRVVARTVVMTDEWLGVRLVTEYERPALLVYSPVETVSLSEGGIERIYQGSTVTALWELEGAAEWRMRLECRVEQL